TLAELRRKVLAPVLCAHLPAIDVQMRKSGIWSAAAWSDVLEQSTRKGRVVAFERRAIQLVALEANRRRRCGTCVGSGGRAAKARNRPGTVGHIPSERAVLIHLVG